MTNQPYDSNLMYSDRKDARVRHEIPLTALTTLDEALRIAEIYVASQERIREKIRS